MKKVLIGLSGGIDSTVSAHLLIKQGFDLQAVFMHLHHTDCNEADYQKARYAAEKLNIKLHVVNMKEHFQKIVYKPFVSSYIKGETPNPCVVCNKDIKFGVLYDFANSLGVDYLATGHYVQNDQQFLYEAKDKFKDQSYFLFHLNKNILPRLIFPMGDKIKNEIKHFGQSIGFASLSNQKESASICFAEKKDYKTVLRKHSDVVDKVGEVLNLQGEVIGQHRGYMHYTIGQRKGFNINVKKSEQHRSFVLKILADKNQIVVGQKEELATKKFSIQGINLFIDKIDHQNIQLLDCEVKVRYRTTKVPCQIKLDKTQHENLTVILAESTYGVAKGQGAVFYQNDKMIGGGWIQ